MNPALLNLTPHHTVREISFFRGGGRVGHLPL